MASMGKRDLRELFDTRDTYRVGRVIGVPWRNSGFPEHVLPMILPFLVI